MNKIAIVTLHFYNNFGSVLQAYALRKILQEKTNGQVDILPYRPALPEYTYFQDKSLQRAYQEKCKKFEDFRTRFLGVKGENQAINQEMEIYNAYIVGSDIVWGKEFSNLDLVYFLSFVPKGCKKIAYAASTILNPNGNTENDALFAKWIPNFDFLSVRESSAVQNIQAFTSKSVSAVLDPSFLLDMKNYENLIIENNNMKGSPYLLSYFLTHDPAVVNYTNMLAQKLGLRVVHYFADYPGRVFGKDAECFAFAGPGEFLGYVKNAACVFTNSFHGTCFSMIYRKPFYTYMAKRAMLSRVSDMVRKLGMEDRFFMDFRDISKVTLQIDYSDFEQRLKVERDNSLKFLQSALGE